MSDLLQTLQWRYATKKMDPAKKVAKEKIDRILEAVRLTASSSGLQQYELFVVTNDALREQIRAHAWNQAQVTECSHLLVFAAWDTYTAERINTMFDLVNAERGIRNEGWEAYRQQLLSTYPQRDAQTNFEHAARQAYIGLGSALIAAAEEIGGDGDGGQSYVISPACASFLAQDGLSLSASGWSKYIRC